MKFFIYAILFLISHIVVGQEKITISHGPYLQNLSENGATIVWTTNRNAVSWVEIAPDDSSHFYVKERPKYFSGEHGIKSVGKIHKVRIHNLESGTTYRYRIYSQEVLEHEGIEVKYGSIAATSVYRTRPLELTTIDPLAESIDFLVVNDIHGNNERFENLLTKGNHETADFIFLNGDMASSIHSEDQVFKDFMDTAIKLFAKEKPFYFVRGNHETRGNFASQLPGYFPSPDDKLYYVLRRGPVGFVVLDCGEDKPDSDIEYCGIADFDKYRDIQAEWLKKAIKTENFADAPFKVAIIHMPPFGGWHGEEETRKKFIPLLNEAGIDVMLCGHLHRYIRQSPQTGVDFPVIVNSNNTIAKVKATKDRMEILIINEQGQQVDRMVVDAH